MLARVTEHTLRNGERVVLRSPTGADAGAMLGFLRQLVRESSQYLNHPEGAFDKVDEPEEAAFLEEIAHHPNDFMIAAWHEGRPVGNVNVRGGDTLVTAHCGDLGMGVLAAYQGQSLGNALLSRALIEADRAGVWNLMLRVRAFNTTAIRLYERHGFARVGTLRAVAQLPDTYADEYLYQFIAREEGVPRP